MELSTTSVVFVLLLTFFHSGEGLKCYSCNSKSDPKCLGSNKELGPESQVECDTAAVDAVKNSLNTATSKVTNWARDFGLDLGKASKVEIELACTKVEVQGKEADDTYVTRGCFPSKKGAEEMCAQLQKSLNTDKTINCSQCSEDLCNSSNGLAPAIFTIFLLVAAVIITGK